MGRNGSVTPRRLHSTRTHTLTTHKRRKTIPYCRPTTRSQRSHPHARKQMDIIRNGRTTRLAMGANPTNRNRNRATRKNQIQRRKELAKTIRIRVPRHTMRHVTPGRIRRTQQKRSRGTVRKTKTMGKSIKGVDGK